MIIYKIIIYKIYVKYIYIYNIKFINYSVYLFWPKYFYKNRPNRYLIWYIEFGPNRLDLWKLGVWFGFSVRFDFAQA